MSRRSKPAKRVPLADPVYNSVDISKFINRIMRRGKKSLAEKIFYATLTKIEEKTGEKPILLLDDVLSELDRNRQNYLLEHIKGIQTIITCTGLEEFIKNGINIQKTFEIESGKVKR